MFYVRAGGSTRIGNGILDGIEGLPVYTGANFNVWLRACMFDMSGGDVIGIGVAAVNVAAVGPPEQLDIVLDITLPADAQPGVRDLLIGNAENNAPPTIYKNAVTVLPSAFKGAQLWFFTAWGYDNQANLHWVTQRPDDYGMNIVDNYDPQLPVWKMQAYDGNLAGNSVGPRLYMWDCIKDDNKTQPSMDPMITGVTAGEINVNNQSDLHVTNPDDGSPTEGDVAGYIDKKDNGDWVEPRDFMINRTIAEQRSNLPNAWQLNAAAAIAPDEFQDGDYNIAPLGCTDPGKRATNIAGPAYTNYRGVMGFPDTSTAVGIGQQKYRQGTAAAPIVLANKVPRNYTNRKPYFYMATPHWFYSREKIASALNQVANAVWAAGGMGGTLFNQLSPGDYYNSYLLNAIQFLGLPLYYRTMNKDTAPPEWDAAQTAVPGAFQPFQSLPGKLGSMWYNTASSEQYCRSLIYITIDPVECVLPGPRWGGGLNNELTYRRNSESFTKDSKIRIWFQDLWPYGDQNYSDGTGTLVNQKHKLSEPVLLLEAPCPRFDVKTEFTDWATDANPFPKPGYETLLPNHGRTPNVTMESNPFTWTQVCRSEEDGRNEKGERGGSSGTFNDGPDAFECAQGLMKEFGSLKCKLVVHAAYWQRNEEADPPLPVLPNNLKLASYTSRNATPPYDGHYWEPYEGREGTYICPSGYIEVVDDD